MLLKLRVSGNPLLGFACCHDITLSSHDQFITWETFSCVVNRKDKPTFVTLRFLSAFFMQKKTWWILYQNWCFRLYLTIWETERILTLALVSKKWFNIVHSGTPWKKVDFDYQRNVTPDILDKYVYAGTRKILLSECCFLKLTDICSVLRWCKAIEVLIVPWIGYKKETVPDFTGMLNIEHLGFLELSHCKVTDSLFSQIPVKCPMLKFLLIQDCQEITEQAYIAAGFKKHQNLKILKCCIQQKRSFVKMRDRTPKI